MALDIVTTLRLRRVRACTHPLTFKERVIYYEEHIVPWLGVNKPGHGHGGTWFAGRRHCSCEPPPRR
jgi:hypothetical protein